MRQNGYKWEELNAELDTNKNKNLEPNSIQIERRILESFQDV